MRSSLLSSLAVLVGLSALPACTVNYYVPAATDAPTASNPPQRTPPRDRWQPAPGPRTPAPRYYPPVAQAPQPGPPRQTPPPPVRQNPPAPAPAPAPAPPVRVVRPVRPVKVTPAPTSTPPPAPPVPTTPPPAPTPVPAPPLPAPPAPAPAPPVLTTIPSSLPQDEAPLPPQNTAASPVIVFGRTPCLGKCPHFTAQIFADGRVQYEGFRYALVEGQREAKLSPETVRDLLQAADKAGFRQLPNTYASGASDMPSTGLTILYPDGTMKSVRAEDNVPAELQSLFTRINAEIEHALGVAGDR